MGDIYQELQKNQVVLLLVPSAEYNQTIVKNMKKLAGKNVCYITLNKTFDSLKELFNKNKIDTKDIVFIDAISSTIKKTPGQTEGAYFISSPGALTEIAISVDKFLRHNFDYIIFDSLTNLLIYEKKEPVAKFVSSIVNKIKASKTKAIFYALSLKEQSDLIEQTSMFVDKVINIEK